MDSTESAGGKHPHPGGLGNKRCRSHRGSPGKPLAHDDGNITHAGLGHLGHGDEFEFTLRQAHPGNAVNDGHGGGDSTARANLSFPALSRF